MRRQPAAVRFQAEHSNDCWQFDLSPSDLKEIKEPLWLQPNKGAPTLMLFSVVDDRSGVAYQEYPVPSEDTMMHRIIRGPDGNMWFTEMSTDKVGRLSLVG